MESFDKVSKMVEIVLIHNPSETTNWKYRTTLEARLW